MQTIVTKTKSSWHPFVKGLVTLSLGALAVSAPAIAQEPDLNAGMYFYPGNLVVSRSVYDNNAKNVKVGALLPPNCTNTVGSCVAATNNGKYPEVFNNVIPDAAFGITSTIFLDQITRLASCSTASKSPTAP
jgi:hypothetical protein